MRVASPKPLRWIASSKKDLKKFPGPVQRDLGYALDEAQHGGTSSDAKPLKGFSGVSVMEIVVDHQTDTYRGVYTAKYGDVVFVLHAFQKKSKHGTEMTQSDKDLIRQRLRAAEMDYLENREN